MKPKIYVVGVSHISKKDGERIPKHAEGLRPEAIFIERPEKGPKKLGLRNWVFVALRNPIFFLAAVFYIALLTIPKCVERFRSGEFGLADWIYAKRASKKLGNPIHKVDDNIYEMTVSRHAGWTPLSWVIALFPVCIKIWLLPPLSIFLFIFFFIIFFILFVRSGVPTRNRHMMDRMNNVITSRAYKKMFLVTGKKHVRDFKERLSKKYDVEDFTGR